MSFPQRLSEGYLAFRTGRLAAEQSRYRELAERGQSPETMVIGCCDSRVSPEVIFDAGPGELFVVRNIANLVPPYEVDSAHHGVSAALEFAVLALQVRHIVVLGHAGCGGVKAFAEGAAPGDFIGKWMSLLKPVAATLASADASSASYITQLEQASMLGSIENLKTFPFIRSRCERGTLALHCAYFGVASGELSVRNEKTGRFEPITPPSASPR
jgi:carbonic anhydrase